MNTTIIISIISTLISCAALIFSYRAFNYGKYMRLRDRIIDIRERTLNIKYRLLQCEINMRLVNLDDKKEEKEISELISNPANKMDTLNEYQSLLNLKQSELSDKYIDDLTVDTKHFEGETDLLEHKINMLINNKKHNNSLELTGEGRSTSDMPE
jgi:hypothetical protein